MATRCYFPETEAAAVTPTISSSDWGHIPGTSTRRRLRQRAADASTLTTTAYTPDAADHVSVSVNAHHRQYVSDPLCAQTISGTVTAQFQTLEAHANNNLQITVGIWLVSRDGTTLRATLLAPTRAGTEPTTALRNTSLTSQALTSQTAVDGDRLVIEIGLGGNPTATSGTQGHNGSIRWGGTASGGDLPVDETSALTTLRPWLQFSADLAFGLTVATESYAVTGVATDRFTHSVPFTAAVYDLTGTDVTLTFGEAGSGAFSLVLDGSSYALTGTAVTLLAGWRVAAGADAYVLTGSTASGLAGWRVTAASDAYTLSGTVVDLRAQFRLGLAGDAYALGGSDSSLRAGWQLDAAGQSYALTGADATLTFAGVGVFTLGVEDDSYVLTGTAAGFTHSVPAAPGDYVLTGSDVAFAHGTLGAFTLALDGGGYVLIGEAVAWLVGARAAAESGSYAVTGDVATLRVAWRLDVVGDAYGLTGASLDLRVPRTFVLDGGTYELVGEAITLGGSVFGDFTLVLDEGLYQFWGDETVLDQNPGIGLDAGEYVLAGADTDLWSGPEGSRRYGDDFVILRRRRRR